jgi:hypothetical protein
MKSDSIQMKYRLSVEALSTLVHIEKKTMQYPVRTASKKTRAAVLAVMKATMAAKKKKKKKNQYPN